MKTWLIVMLACGLAARAQAAEPTASQLRSIIESSDKGADLSRRVLVAAFPRLGGDAQTELLKMLGATLAKQGVDEQTLHDAPADARDLFVEHAVHDVGRQLIDLALRPQQADGATPEGLEILEELEDLLIVEHSNVLSKSLSETTKRLQGGVLKEAEGLAAHEARGVAVAIAKKEASHLAAPVAKKLAVEVLKREAAPIARGAAKAAVKGGGRL